MKAVRTKYINVLKKELENGLRLLQLSKQVSEESRVRRANVTECKIKLKYYIKYVDVQSDKLARAIGDSDDNYTESMIEDLDLIIYAESVYAKLESLESHLCDSGNGVF